MSPDPAAGDLACTSQWLACDEISERDKETTCQCASRATGSSPSVSNRIFEPCTSQLGRCLCLDSCFFPGSCAAAAAAAYGPAAPPPSLSPKDQRSCSLYFSTIWSSLSSGTYLREPHKVLMGLQVSTSSFHNGTSYQPLELPVARSLPRWGSNELSWAIQDKTCCPSHPTSRRHRQVAAGCCNRSTAADSGRRKGRSWIWKLKEARGAHGRLKLPCRWCVCGRCLPFSRTTWQQPRQPL